MRLLSEILREVGAWAAYGLAVFPIVFVVALAVGDHRA